MTHPLNPETLMEMVNNLVTPKDAMDLITDVTPEISSLKLTDMIEGIRDFLEQTWDIAYAIGRYDEDGKALNLFIDGEDHVAPNPFAIVDDADEEEL